MPSRTLPDYTTGTVTVTNASRTVTGSGTGWTTTLNGVTESTVAAGDMLIVSTGRPVMIESVDSATQITLVEAWPNSTASGSAYKIRRYVALPTGAVLAALQSLEGRGTDTTPLTSYTIDGGTTRMKLRQASGGQGSISVGATGTADGSLIDAVLVSSTALVGIRGAPSEELDVIRSQNATTTARVYNSSTAASSVAEFLAQTGTANSTLSLGAYDNTATPYAALKAGSAATALYRDAASHVWRTADGATTRMQIDSSGNLSVSGQATFSNATAPIIAAKLGPASGQQHTLPAVTSDTVALIDATQTLTNKTLTSPVISTISNSGTVTIPTGTDTLVNLAGTQTLTNKTWNGVAIAGQYGGTGVANTGKTITLGGNFTTSGAYATTLTATATTSVTLPTTGTLATLAGSETLTNKTLTTPVISSISNSGTVTIPTGTVTLATLAGTETLTNKTLTVAAFGAGAVGAPSIAASGDLDTGVWFPAANVFAVSTGGTERARFSGEELLIGTTSSVGSNNRVAIHFDKAALNGISFKQLNDDSGGGQPVLFNNKSGTGIGSITSTASNVAFNTTSDYRLKDNIRLLTGGLDRVMRLRPSEWDWKADGAAGVGFIAHEAQAIRPQAVTGTKDAVDANGTPIYQGIDASFLIADLTAAIQELKAELDEAKARIAALEGTA